MANRTVKDAKSIRGTNPQYLIEKIIRSRIYDSRYWKEECFALTAELLVDKAMELRYVGGVLGGNIKPTPFLCLVLKMLQIQPDKDIIVEFIKNEEFKYVRALGALYMRLTGSSLDVYRYLEPLLNDYRKLRRQNKQGQYELVHMDEFIDSLLRDERSCDIILPRIQKRHILEENNELEFRISALEDDADENLESSDEDAKLNSKKRNSNEYEREKDSHRRDREKRHSRKEKDRGRSRSRSRNRDRRDRRSSRDRYRSKHHSEKDHTRGRDRERRRERDRDRPRH